MAISPVDGSGGYGNRKYTARQHAISAPFQGYGRYAVLNERAWTVVPNPNVARGLTVVAGVGWGDGVVDENVGDYPLPSLAAPAQGTAPYAVFARRDWQAQQTSFVAVPNIVMPQFTQAGVKADQLLAVAIVTAGSTQITDILDRRCWVEGLRQIRGRRAAAQNLAAEVVNSLAGLQQNARAGEYQLRAAASVDTASGSLGNLGFLVNGVDKPLNAVNLVANREAILTGEDTFQHVGGPLNVQFTLKANAGWAGGTVRVGATVSATWVGPLT